MAKIRFSSGFCLIIRKPTITFFNNRQRNTILQNLELSKILQNETISLLQVREARDYFAKNLEDVINVAECLSHPWSEIQFWSSFQRKCSISIKRHTWLLLKPK